MKYVPPDPNSVPAFVSFLGDEIKVGPKDRSVVEFAASIHAKFVSIHPFVDGNGRCGRLLMNSILLANQLPVVLVNYDDRARYLDSLEEANQTGDISNFVGFILECSEASINDLRYGDDDSANNIEKGPEEATSIGIQETKDQPESPLQVFMQSRLQIQRRKTESNYNTCIEGFSLLGTEIKSIIDGFNTNVEYTEYGYSMFFKKFDVISMEKYHALANNKRASQTWFVMFGVNWKTLTEKILCFFQSTSSAFKALNQDLEVSLALARYNGETYIRLMNEPITIREIGYSDGQIVFFCNDGESHAGHVKSMIENLLVEVMDNYFIE